MDALACSRGADGVRRMARWRYITWCLALLVLVAVPSRAFATYADYDVDNAAAQDIGSYGETIYAEEIPDGTYEIDARTSSYMCIMYRTYDDAKDKVSKEKCYLQVRDGVMTAYFYISNMYTRLYLGGSAEDAASLTNEDGSDDSAYLVGDPAEGYVPHYYAMNVPALNYPMKFAAFAGGNYPYSENPKSSWYTRAKWYSRTVVFLSSKSILDAIAEAGKSSSSPVDEGSEDGSSSSSGAEGGLPDSAGGESGGDGGGSGGSGGSSTSSPEGGFGGNGDGADVPGGGSSGSGDSGDGSAGGSGNGGGSSSGGEAASGDGSNGAGSGGSDTRSDDGDGSGSGNGSNGSNGSNGGGGGSSDALPGGSSEHGASQAGPADGGGSQAGQGGSAAVDAQERQDAPLSDGSQPTSEGAEGRAGRGAVSGAVRGKVITPASLELPDEAGKSLDEVQAAEVAADRGLGLGEGMALAGSGLVLCGLGIQLALFALARRLPALPLVAKR